MARLYEVQREGAQGQLGERGQLQHGRVQRVAHRVVETGDLQFIEQRSSVTAQQSVSSENIKPHQIQDSDVVPLAPFQAPCLSFHLLHASMCRM